MNDASNHLGSQGNAHHSDMPSSSLHLKGLEEEVYGGKTTGQIVGLSDRVTADMPVYHREPDSRNIEYTTEPHRDYHTLGRWLLERRTVLRRYLLAQGAKDGLTEKQGYTLIPGASMSLGDSTRFYRSDPSHPYHDHIEQTYFTNVVTTSAHLNVGVTDVPTLMRAMRVVRMEAALFLAMSACSPFLDGRVTGAHSTRWHIFPITPKGAPMFTSHEHYIEWVHQQLVEKRMNNSRHLWLSVRPNGSQVPEQIDRLELRICDRIDSIPRLLAITALLEARLFEVIEEASLDPLHTKTTTASQWVQIADANDQAVAQKSLDAEIIDWQSGERLTAQRWLSRWIDQRRRTAERYGFEKIIEPIDEVLSHGNPAQQWLGAHERGQSIASIIQEAIEQMQSDEADYAADLAKGDACGALAR